MRWLRKELFRNERLAQLIVAIALLAVVLAITYFWKQASPNRDDAKLKELRRMVAELPTFPSFAEDTTDETSRAIDAGIYKYYCSSAPYGEVKNFYTDILPSQGWQLLTEEELRYWFRETGGKHLVFKKGEFILAVDYYGDLNRKCKYSVSYVWHNKSFWDQ